MSSEAYAAGIIDGEGAIGIGHKSGSNSYHLLVQVSMKMPTQVPKWLFDNFGGHYGEYAQSKNAWGEGTIAKWSIHGSEAQEFIGLIVPHLLDKLDKAKMAIVFPIASSSHKGIAETDMQQHIYEEMRKLQSKIGKGEHNGKTKLG